MAGSVNQATGLPDFEDVLRTGASVGKDFQPACIRTNPKVTVAGTTVASHSPRGGVAGPKLLAEGPKPKACSGISSCPREVDQSPTPVVFRAILGINLLLRLWC